MSGWQALVSDSLIGTARRPPTVPIAGDEELPLGSLLRKIHGPDAETRLLDVAAVLSAYRRAGRRAPLDLAPLPDACPPDSVPPCPEPAALRLDAMLDGEYRLLLPEWLGLVAEEGMRVADDRLPAILQAGTNSRQLRPLIAPVLGERGRWLASLNEEWAWAAAATGGGAAPGAGGGGGGGQVDWHRSWTTTSSDARWYVLFQARLESPALGRALLMSTWDTDSADDRAAFVGILATNLSIDDEPFLEATALHDRIKKVRTAAAVLLSSLPHSRLAQRMAERTRPLLHVSGRFRPALEVTLPQSLDKQAVADGVQERPPQDTGVKAWWLQQMLAATPLATWTASLQRSPADLVELAARSAGASEVLAGWAIAAGRQGDVEWATALIRHVVTPELVKVLPHGQSEAVAIERLNDRGLDDTQTVAILRNCEPPWSLRLSQAVVAALASHRVNTRQAASQLLEWLRPAALAIDPGLAPEAVAALSRNTDDQWWATTVDEFLDVLRNRHQMRNEIANVRPEVR